MNCPKCGSENVNVQVIQTGAKTSKKGNGCLWSIGRFMLIICTCGLWLLVGHHKGTGKTKITNETVCVCVSPAVIAGTSNPQFSLQIKFVTRNG